MRWRDDDMSTLTQIREIVVMNLQSIPQRLGASLVIVIGIAGVVGVLVALLSMSQGLGKTLGSTGAPIACDYAWWSNGELSSFLDRPRLYRDQTRSAIARGKRWLARGLG